MTRNKRLIINCSGWMIGSEVCYLGGWEVYVNPGELNPAVSDPRCKFSRHYTKAIVNINPDYVLSVNIGCTEPDFDRMEKPKGPTYITWSTDSYRHTRRAETSDLHLSAIPDASFDPERDTYMPLWFDRPVDWDLIPLEDRTIPLGIAYRPYGIMGGWRERQIEYLGRCITGMQVVTNVSRDEYLDQVRRFRVGLNVPVYPDALPNFRTFELGAFGVWSATPTPTVPAGYRFNGWQGYAHGYNHNNPIEAQEAVGHDYDWRAVATYFDEHHRFIHRLRAIMNLVGEKI